MKRRARDSQRSAVYRAENEAGIVHSRAEFDWKGCQAFVDHVVKLHRVHKLRHPDGKHYDKWCGSVTVGDGRGRSTASGSYSGIKLPKWARNKGVILHELAHTITRRRFGLLVAWHGAEFAYTYHQLVRIVMGKKAATQLEENFNKNKVDYFL